MFMRTLSKSPGIRLLLIPKMCVPHTLLHQTAQFVYLKGLVQNHMNPTVARCLFRKIMFFKIVPRRMYASASTPEPTKPTKPANKLSGMKPPPLGTLPQNTSPTSNKSPLQNLNQLTSQLTTEENKVEKSLSKVPEPQIDINSKKFGWMVSGTAICVMSALFGKLYMLCGAVPLLFYHSRDMDVIIKTFKRDSKFLWRYAKCWFLSKRIKNGNLTLHKVFQQMEKKHPDKIMLQMHDQNWKFKDVASYANRTSRLMQKYGFQKGDVVAMFALNSPEMVAIVLGMANIGIITTLISTELRNEGLTHAIKNSGCKGIIFDDELMHAFGDVYKNFDDAKIFQMRHKAKQPEFRVLEEELLKEYNDLPEVFVNVQHDDPLLYMYSPDDTVFREPIVVTHEKFIFDSSATAMMLDLTSTEKIYNPTPLHETTGIILGIGPSITNGVPTVLRSKFSASDYFRECYVYNCTVGQYTGSMCKQLLLSPVSPIETFHPVKVMYGSGLESDYWQEFVNRFGTKMHEVHDASNENINLINLEGKIGVVGFRPKLAPSFLFPHYVIKVFGKDNIPVRNSHGYCQLCDYGEPGMLIKVWTGSGNLPPKVKTIQNIFKNGDMAITTGEILTIDDNLYLRPLKKHVDKSWMNKLVTSEEVEYIASKLTSKKCAAYSLPVNIFLTTNIVENMGYKQDIEILAIKDPDKTLDMKKFTDDLIDHLPRNWVPHYVRIVSDFELLDSKQVDKQRLVEQGLNMEGDLVHYFDKNSMCYKPLIWSKGNRPQMIVNESKIQPLIETGVKNVINKSLQQETVVVECKKQPTSAVSEKNLNENKITPGTTRITVSIKPPISQRSKTITEVKAHTTAPFVTEKKAATTSYTTLKPDPLAKILKDSEPKLKAEEDKKKSPDLADIISRKFKNFTDPVMTNLMKRRLKQKDDVQVPTKSDKKPSTDHLTPFSSNVKEAPETIEAKPVPSVEEKTASLIKNVLEHKIEPDNKKNEEKNKTDTVVNKVNNEKTGVGLNNPTTIPDNSKPTIPTGTSSTNKVATGQEQSTKTDSTKK